MNYSKWNDNRKTNAFKSTRRNNNSHQKEENNRPINTRIWKNKTLTNPLEKEATNNVFQRREWNRDSGDIDKDNSYAFSTNVTNRNSVPLKINSKWTATREKNPDRNNVFSTRNTNNIFSTQNTMVPEKKSFNKKIVIIERKTQKQLEADKKGVYDSFIKESFILKLEDTLGQNVKNKNTNKDKDSATDSWHSWDDSSNPTEHLTEFDKWEKDFFDYIDGYSDDYNIVQKRRKQFFFGRLKDLYEHYILPKQDMSVPKLSYDKSYADKQHKLMLMKQLRGLSVLPAIIIENTQDNTNDVYESLYDFMISKKMSVGDISFEYNVKNLLKYDDKVLQKEFYKLRKKYNSIKKIQKKLENKESVQKGEQDKYNTRHECIFLYHRLKYYDEYYMDGKLNFTNNTK